jgi:hypothetical protein
MIFRADKTASPQFSFCCGLISPFGSQILIQLSTDFLASRQHLRSGLSCLYLSVFLFRCDSAALGILPFGA